MTSAADRKPASTSRARFGAESLIAVFGLAAIAFAWTLDRVWFEDHLTQSFCVHDVKQLHRLLGVRVGLLCAGLVLLLAVRPLVGKWMGRQSAKSAFLSILRVSLAVALALGVSAVILRERKGSAMVIAPPALPHIQLDSEIGWTGDPNGHVMLPADDRQISYAFDEAGNRKSSEETVTDADAPSILFAGESITEGIGVQWEESYPAVVATDLRLQPVEAAVHGYGNDQIYWAMQKALAKLHHPVAVVTFLIPELLERDLDKTRPRLTLGAGDVLLKVPAADPPPNWWKDFPLRNVAHGIFPYHDDSAISLARAIFRATANEAKARGAYPLFLIANWNAPCLPPDPGMPTLTDRLFGGLDVPWTSVTIDPYSMEHTTHHPNAKAHRVLADAIEKALIDAKVATK